MGVMLPVFFISNLPELILHDNAFWLYVLFLAIGKAFKPGYVRRLACFLRLVVSNVKETKQKDCEKRVEDGTRIQEVQR